MRPGWRTGFALLLGLELGLGLVAALRDSSVADEHPHILSGWLFWASGRFAGGLDNPPLGQLLVAAPLRLLGADYRFPSDEHLFLARLPVLWLGLGLALLLARWGQRLGERGMALAVLLGCCLEPNLLAHGHLATLDMPLTLFWWAALWLWREYLFLESNGAAASARMRAAALFAGAVAMAALTKFSGLFLLPGCWLAAVAVLRGIRPRLRATAVLLGAAVGVALWAHLAYAFEPSRWGLPESLVAALSGKFAHRGEGHFAYLASRTSLRGFPEYYVVALLLKTPLPLLVLACAGVVMCWRRIPFADRMLLCLPAVALMAAFTWIGVNIGVRHVLPVLPALLLLAAAGMQELWRRGRWARAGVVTLLVLWAAGFARAAPQYLAYFNAIAGGPAGGHRLLLDSNLAWGQDDARLARFLASAAQRGEKWEVNPPGERARTGRIAVDANTLHALLRRDTGGYAWLRPLRPVGFAGWSWRLYDLGIDDFARRASSRPVDMEVRIAYAEALAWEGAGAPAGAVYEALASAGGPSPVFRSAARVALEKGDVDAAAVWVRRGLDRFPADRELLELLERVGVETQAAAGADTTAWRDALARGLWWAEHADLERALPHLVRAVEVGPREPEALHALGVALVQLGRFGEAAGAFESAGAIARAELGISRRLAWTEATLDSGSAASGEGAASAPGAESAAPVPGSWAPDTRSGRPTEAMLMDLAAAHFQARRYDRAAAALVGVLRRDPGNAQAMALLCEVQVRVKLRITSERLLPRRVAPATPGSRRRDTEAERR